MWIVTIRYYSLKYDKDDDSCNGNPIKNPEPKTITKHFNSKKECKTYALHFKSVFREIEWISIGRQLTLGILEDHELTTFW